MNCPNCGKEIPNPDAVFCPYCAKSLIVKRYQKFPLISGILTIVSAILVIVAGAISISGAFSTYGGYGYGFIGGTNIFFWVAGIFEIAAFSVGLTGGIFQIRRMLFLGSVFSNVLLIVSAIIIMAESFFNITLSSGSGAQYFGLLFFAIPSLILSILGVVFTALSKAEFKN